MKEHEIQTAHRWFAVESNNQAWDLAAKPQRSEDENREMLFAAYTAAFHWSKVGQPINHARAAVLLARVHSLLGHGRMALEYATESLSHCERNAGEDWDLAFCHWAMCFACHSLGEAELHARHYTLAARLGQAIKDPEDRRVFLEEFSRIPKPPAPAIPK